MVDPLRALGRMLRRKAPVTEEIATTHDGRDITRGYVDQLHHLYPMRDQRLRTVGGAGAYGGYETYTNMLQDDRVHSTLAQRRSAVVAREVEVVPGDNRRDSKKCAEFVREVLDHCGWDDLTDKMLYGVFYGYSVAECLWARNGQQVFPDRIRVRDRRRFVFDRDFKPRLLTYENPHGEALPERKFWTFSTGADHDDDPYGVGLGWHLYWPVWFKRNQVKFWLVYLEKYGMPTAVGKYGASASPEDKQQLLRAARAVHGDSAVRIPDSMMLELLESRRSGRVDYADFYERMQSAITTIVLSQTMTTDDGSSLSQAQVHMEVRKEVVESDDTLVCGSFTNQVATWLRDWNFPNAAVPTVRRIMDDPPDTQKLAERDKNIKEIGYRPTKDYVEETYNIEVEDPEPPEPGRPGPGDVEMAEADGGAASLLPISQAVSDAVGPLVDVWIDRLRAFAGADGSLPDLRDRLEREGVGAIEIKDVSEMLGLALAAAHLAGRYDADAAQVELAEESGARLRFNEQIRFFRRKLNLPTKTWADIWQAQHDVAFVVAGAAKSSLVDDLHGAVKAAIEDGETLEAFRSRFDSIVDKHGWSYRGNRDWRTRVIYETNLRTSYAAGRYEQMKDIASRRPYWRYRHSHASESPRLDHQAWDGLVLRHDDPWWDTHFPPNGWGCKCSTESLSKRDLKRLGKDGPDKAPADGMREVVVGRGTRAERHVTVPTGIDPGFAYAPGKEASLGSAVRNATRAAIAQEPGIAARGVGAILDHPGAMAAHTDRFARWRKGDAERADGAEAFRLGVVPAAVQDRLRNRHGIALDTAVVTVTRRELAHTGRSVKIERGGALDDADLDRLPEIIARPEDVLLDTGAGDPTLLFVFTPGSDAGRKGKIVVRVNYAEFIKIGGAERGMKYFGNAVRTAGYVKPGDLLESRYESLRDGGA